MSLQLVPKQQVVSSVVVKNLRDLLAQIEAGDILDVAVVATNRDGDTLTCHSVINYTRILGSVEYMRHRILEEWVDNRED